MFPKKINCLPESSLSVSSKYQSNWAVFHWANCGISLLRNKNVKSGYCCAYAKLWWNRKQERQWFSLGWCMFVWGNKSCNRSSEEQGAGALTSIPALILCNIETVVHVKNLVLWCPAVRKSNNCHFLPRALVILQGKISISTNWLQAMLECNDNKQRGLSQKASVWILALALTRCVALGNLLSISLAYFLNTIKIARVIIVSTSWGLN